MLANSINENQINDTFDPSKKLHPRHSFTLKWLLESLRENDEIYQHLHGFKPVKDIEAYDISHGKGFISIVLKCTVKFVDSKEDSYTAILKIPGFDSYIEAQGKSSYDVEIITEGIKEQFVRIHNCECDFYNKLSKILDAPIPRIFKTEDWILDIKEGCIHMEDLTKRGRTVSYFENLNMPQIKCFVRELAKMHKNILTADPNIWKGKYLKGQNAIVDYLDYLPTGCEAFLDKCKRKDQFKPLFDKYSKFMISRDYYLYVQKQAYKDLGLAPVIVHGDIYGLNLLYTKNETNELQNEIAAIIDWQQMREGSPMEDLARFLTHCCDGVIRRQAEAFIFEYYFECLKEEFGDATKVPYTLKQLKTAYYYSFLSQAFFTVLMVGNLINAENVSDEIKEAFFDFGVLKALHNLEDVDRILQGELKEFFEKYNH
uniref:CHK kinase-like domain-containing protein n=1 Tax=Panagrolaimus sp. PS1159 TaxID=55785 RepID=A0AC35FV69_9BILA